MTADSTRSRYRQLLRDPVLWAGAVVSFAAFLAYAFPGSDPENRYWSLELYSLVPILTLGIVAPWIAIPRLKGSSARLFWGFWTLSLFCLLSVRLLNICFDGSYDFVRLSVDVGYVLFYLAAVLALQVKPGRRAGYRGWRAHDFLESAGVGAFVLALMVYFVLIPQWMSPELYHTWIPSLTLFVSLDAFIFLNLVYLRQTTPDSDWRITYTWLAIAALSWGVTDLAEFLDYLEVAPLPPYGFQDFLWYLPWFFVLLAARVRAFPVPACFAGLAGGRAPLTESQRLARPGWLVLAALTLPMIHFGSNLLSLQVPETRDARELAVLFSLSLLLAFAWLHQRALHKRAMVLTAKNREGEARRRLLAAAVEQASDGILIADAERIVRFANQSFQAAGGDSGVFLGSPLEAALPKTLEGSGSGPLEEALAEGRAWEGRDRFTAEDGTERENSIRVSPVREPDGEVGHWVVVQRDVTYLTQLERQFRQGQKMEALGTLAGGIAHDFNNILGAIYGYGELLSWELEPGSEAREDLQGLMTAAERATELVSQILTFSRQGEDERKPLALESVVREALGLLRATLPSTIEIHEEIQDGPGAILGVRSQIHQVALNLGSNAASAMAETGGTLRVSLTRVELDPVEAETLGVPARDFFRLAFQDTGVGMEKKTLERMFDPFFSTKGLGEGTGLGLSVVHGVVTAHGGVVRVESEPGSGTLFEVFLPAAGVDAKPEEVALEPPPAGSGQRLVVVDDEPELVAVSSAILESLGYEVTGFTDSLEARDYVLGDPASVELMFTDQTMPGLTGLELAKELSGRVPKLRVILATGYSELVSKERLDGARVGRFLKKPFTKDELGWAVADLLAADPGVAVTSSRKSPGASRPGPESGPRPACTPG